MNAICLCAEPEKSLTCPPARDSKRGRCRRCGGERPLPGLVPDDEPTATVPTLTACGMLTLLALFAIYGPKAFAALYPYLP